MAKKKIKFELKQDVLAMCNNKIRKRLLKIPIAVKPKDYLFKAKVDIEVENPEWDKKAVERSLMLNIKRSMQILSVRATTLLENLDKENPADFKEELKLIEKLKKTLKTYGDEVQDQAEYNLGQIIDDITKDVAKWGKAGETLNAMKAVDKGDKDLERTIKTLADSLNNVAEKIKDLKNVKEERELRKRDKELGRALASIERQREDDIDNYNLAMKGTDKEVAASKLKIVKDHNKYDREKKEKEEDYRDEIKDFAKDTIKELDSFVKEGWSAYATYRKDRGDFHGILKNTAKKMHKMVDSKSKGNKAIAELQDMLQKKVKPAADAYGKYLDGFDNDIKDVIGRLKTNRVSKGDIQKALPKPDSNQSKALATAFVKVKKHMKAEKIQ